MALETVIRNQIKQGMDVSEVMSMPISFIMKILEEEVEVEVERTESMIEAFM